MILTTIVFVLMVVIAIVTGGIGIFLLFLGITDDPAFRLPSFVWFFFCLCASYVAYLLSQGSVTMNVGKGVLGIQ